MTNVCKKFRRDEEKTARLYSQLEKQRGLPASIKKEERRWTNKRCKYVGCNRHEGRKGEGEAIPAASHAGEQKEDPKATKVERELELNPPSIATRIHRLSPLTSPH